MRERFTRQLPLVLGLACVALQLALARGSIASQPELDSIGRTQQLAWGYADGPPLSIALLRLVRLIFGDSLLALRVVPALAGGATVALTGVICRRMGGGAWAQALAMIPAIVAPAYLAQRQVYGKDVLDVFFWTVCAFVLVKLFATGERVLWIALGIVLGVGLLNSTSVLWLGFGLAIGLRLSPQRGWYMSAWPWIAGVLSFLIFAPHLAWQVQHGWPTLQLFRSALGSGAAARAPADFLWGQLSVMNPATILVAACGLVFLFLPGEGRAFRPFAFVFVSVLLLRAVFPGSRPSDLAPAYPPLLAAGGVALTRWSRRRALHTGASGRRGPSGGSTRIESPGRTSPPTTTIPMTAARSTTRPLSSTPFVAASRPASSLSI